MHTFVLGEMPLVAKVCNFTHGSQAGGCNQPDEFFTAVPLSYQLFSHLFHHSKVIRQ